MAVKTPITTILASPVYLVHDEQVDAWLNENLASATLEELLQTKDNNGFSILHTVNNLSQMRPVFLRLRQLDNTIDFSSLTSRILTTTPLHQAKTSEITEFLLEQKRIFKGAALTLEEINPENNYGTTPLHYAKTAEQTKFLLDAMQKAKGEIPLTLEEVNPKDNNGYTPLHSAKSAEQTKFLLDAMQKAKGAIPLTLEEVNPVANNGRTPLHFAKTAEQTKFLLDAMQKAKGAIPLTLEEVNPKDNNGYTPLHSAKSAEQTKFLLDAMQKAKGEIPLTLEEINPENNDGYTPLRNANTAEQKLILRCEISLAKVHENSATQEEIAGNAALTNLKKNDYNMIGLSMADLRTIKAIHEFAKKHAQQIEAAAETRKGDINMSNIYAAIQNYAPDRTDFKPDSPIRQILDSQKKQTDRTFEPSPVNKEAKGFLGQLDKEKKDKGPRLPE